MKNKKLISKMGYRDDSPYRDRSHIDIHTPDGSIDMSETGIPLWANGRILPPYSGTHQFDTNVVREIPIAQSGHTVKQRRGVRENPDGTVSSHLMKAEYVDDRGWVAFPSLFQDSKPYADDQENWVDMSNEKNGWWPIYEEAVRRGEIYDFGEDKEAALAFGMGSWKDQLPSHLQEKREGGEYEELELTDEEIEEYRRGGHVVEELPKAHEGGRPGHVHPKDEYTSEEEYQKALEEYKNIYAKRKELEDLNLKYSDSYKWNEKHNNEIIWKDVLDNESYLKSGSDQKFSSLQEELDWLDKERNIESIKEDLIRDDLHLQRMLDAGYITQDAYDKKYGKRPDFSKVKTSDEAYDLLYEYDDKNERIRRKKKFGIDGLWYNKYIKEPLKKKFPNEKEYDIESEKAWRETVPYRIENFDESDWYKENITPHKDRWDELYNREKYLRGEYVSREADADSTFKYRPHTVMDSEYKWSNPIGTSDAYQYAYQNEDDLKEAFEYYKKDIDEEINEKYPISGYRLNSWSSPEKEETVYKDKTYAEDTELGMSHIEDAPLLDEKGNIVTKHISEEWRGKYVPYWDTSSARKPYLISPEELAIRDRKDYQQELKDLGLYQGDVTGEDTEDWQTALNYFGDNSTYDISDAYVDKGLNPDGTPRSEDTLPFTPPEGYTAVLGDTDPAFGIYGSYYTSLTGEGEDIPFGKTKEDYLRWKETLDNRGYPTKDKYGPDSERRVKASFNYGGSLPTTQEGGAPSSHYKRIYGHAKDFGVGNDRGYIDPDTGYLYFPEEGQMNPATGTFFESNQESSVPEDPWNTSRFLYQPFIRGEKQGVHNDWYDSEGNFVKQKELFETDDKMRHRFKRAEEDITKYYKDDLGLSKDEVKENVKSKMKKLHQMHRATKKMGHHYFKEFQNPDNVFDNALDYEKKYNSFYYDESDDPWQDPDPLGKKAKRAYTKFQKAWRNTPGNEARKNSRQEWKEAKERKKEFIEDFADEYNLTPKQYKKNIDQIKQYEEDKSQYYKDNPAVWDENAMESLDMSDPPIPISSPDPYPDIEWNRSSNKTPLRDRTLKSLKFKKGGEYMDLDLTEDQIKNFKDGGFVVEDLPKAQTGNPEFKQPINFVAEDPSEEDVIGPETSDEILERQWHYLNMPTETKKPVDKDTYPNQILTYKDHPDWFNSHSWADKEQVFKRIYSGNWGYNPSTESLYKLEALRQKFDTKEDHRQAYGEREGEKPEYLLDARDPYWQNKYKEMGFVEGVNRFSTPENVNKIFGNVKENRIKNDPIKNALYNNPYNLNRADLLDYGKEAQKVFLHADKNKLDATEILKNSYPDLNLTNDEIHRYLYKISSLNAGTSQEKIQRHLDSRTGSGFGKENSYPSYLLDMNNQVDAYKELQEMGDDWSFRDIYNLVNENTYGDPDAYAANKAGDTRYFTNPDGSRNEKKWEKWLMANHLQTMYHNPVWNAAVAFHPASWPVYGTLGATMLPGDVQELASNPSWSNAGNVGMDLLMTSPYTVPPILKGYNKIATGNSIIPYAWKSGVDGVSNFKQFDKLKGVSLTKQEAELLQKWQYSSYANRMTTAERTQLDNLIKKYNLGDQIIEAPITRIQGYQGDPTKFSTKYGTEFGGGKEWTSPMAFSVGPYQKGRPFNAEGSQRIIIPERYAKNMGKDFFKVPIKDSKNLREVIRNSDQNSIFLYQEKELLGMPRLKVIGRDNSGHFNDIIVKPIGSGGSGWGNIFGGSGSRGGSGVGPFGSYLQNNATNTYNKAIGYFNDYYMTAIPEAGVQGAYVKNLFNKNNPNISTSQQLRNDGTLIEPIIYDNSLISSPLPIDKVPYISKRITPLSQEERIYNSFIPGMNESKITNFNRAGDVIDESGNIINQTYIKSFKDRTHPVRGGKTFSDGVAEYNSLKSMHDLYPDKFVKPIRITVNKKGEATGYMMEKVNGVTLDKWLKDNKMSQLMYEDIKSTIQGLHRKGIYHGDLKANNIIVNEWGNWKIIDPVGFKHSNQMTDKMLKEAKKLDSESINSIRKLYENQN